MQPGPGGRGGLCHVATAGGHQPPSRQGQGLSCREMERHTLGLSHESVNSAPF